MEFGQVKTETGEEIQPPTPIPPPKPQPQPQPQPPVAVAALESLEAAAAAAGGGGGVAPPTTNVLIRQTSIGSTNAAASKINTNCLCSPTTHAGSFRCRLHRAPSISSLQRTKSIDTTDSVAATAPDSS